MTGDGLAVVQALFSVIWRLFTSWHIPGTTVTPAAAFLFFMAVGIGLKFFYRLLGAPDIGSVFSITRSAAHSEAAAARFAARSKSAARSFGDRSK